MTSEELPVKMNSKMRRKIQDEAIDIKKQRFENESTFFQRWRICFIVGGWVLISQLTGFTSPFLPKIKADQLGGDQKAGELQSILGGVGAFVGMFTASIFGQLVDTWGRRPFFIIVSVCNVIVTALTVFLKDKIIIAMIAGSVTGLIQSSFVQAAVADAYSTKMRMQVLAVIMAVGAGSAILVIITTFLTESMCFYLSFGASVLGLIYSWFIPETLTYALEQRKEVEEAFLATTNVEASLSFARESQPQTQSLRPKCENPFSAMSHVVKSKVMLCCVAIFMFYLLAQVGTGDVYMFYLAERVGFTAKDNAYVVMESGIVEPLVYVLVLPLALKYVSPAFIILFALAMLIGELVVIATVWALWPIYAIGLPLVALTNLLPPVILGIIQNNGDERDQGKRMAGVQALSDFADALGPLMFGLMFGNLDAALVFLPFLVSAGMVVIPMFLTLRLTKWIKEEQQQRDEEAFDGLVIAPSTDAGVA